MTAQQGLRLGLKEILAPAVRAVGYKGSGITWRKANAQGDLAIVNVQSSMFSIATRLDCVVNLSLAPAPWISWLNHRQTRQPKSVGESYGMYRRRLHPTGAAPGIDTWWEITRADAAADAVRDMTAQLADDGLPMLERLLDRSNLLAAVRAGDLGDFSHASGDSFDPFAARCEIVLLADAGDSDEVESLLARLAAHPVGAGFDVEMLRNHDAELAAWARARLAGVES